MVENVVSVELQINLVRIASRDDGSRLLHRDGGCASSGRQGNVDTESNCL
jgi:hypothetical protein